MARVNSQQVRSVNVQSRTSQVHVKSAVKNVSVVQSVETEIFDIQGDDPGDLTLIFDNRLI